MSVLTPHNLALLDEWNKAKAELDALTVRERDLRAQVVAAFYPGVVGAEGTENVDLPSGWYLSTVFKKSYTLDNRENATAIVAKNLPSALRDRVITWKPELRVGEYKKLDPAHRDLVNTVLTIKDAMPSVTIKQVK